MPRLYVAGPLFTDAERAWNARLAAELTGALPGWTIDLPQDFCPHTEAGAGAPDYGAIFAACVGHLDRAQAVIAILDGADADSGTCWECGYAFAKGIPVVGLRTDWRPAEDGTANCMLSRSCRAVVKSPAAAIQQLIRLGL
jgi:nucleoside 2-deoxyribosyltransferase